MTTFYTRGPRAPSSRRMDVPAYTPRTVRHAHADDVLRARRQGGLDESFTVSTPAEENAS